MLVLTDTDLRSSVDDSTILLFQEDRPHRLDTLHTSASNELTASLVMTCEQTLYVPLQENISSTFYIRYVKSYDSFTGDALPRRRPTLVPS